MNNEDGLPVLLTTPPVPDNILQVPLPIEGEFAARLVEVWPQRFVWSEAAFALVGFELNVTVTSSVELPQATVEIVHCNT